MSLPELTRDAALGGLLACAGLFDRAAESPVEAQDWVYQDALEALSAVLRADRASLVATQDDTAGLAVIASVGGAGAGAEQALIVQADAIRGLAAGSGRLAMLLPAAGLSAPLLEAVLQPPVASMAAVVLPCGGGVTAALCLSREDPAAPFTDADLQLAVLVGRQLSWFRYMAGVRRVMSEQGVFVGQFMESIPSSMVVVDRRLHVISANRHFLLSVRRSRENAIGRRITDILPAWFIRSGAVEDKLKAVFRSGEPIADGEVRQLGTGNVYFFRFIPITVDGSVKQAMLLADDVTERYKLDAEVRRVERHLAGVVQSASDLLASLDKEGRIVTWNPAAERISGYSPEAATGRYLWDLCAPDDADVLRRMLRQLSPGEQASTLEARLLTPDGRESIVDWSSSRMTDDQGTVAGTVVVGRDLTSYRLMAKQLMQAEKIASLGVMAGGIAHELRTPLTVIQIAAQLLDENPDDPEVRGTCLRKIRDATKRSALIIENLLRFARPEAETKTRILVDSVLDQAVSLLSDQLALQRVQVHRSTVSDDVVVVGNADLLQQVFTNLMLNACSAMSEGGHLRIETTYTDDGRVAISFEDTGVGIPAELMPRLFDPFFTTQPPGSSSCGLGLSISYRIIEQHGGSIGIVSEPGSGSIFTVFLPVP